MGHVGQKEEVAKAVLYLQFGGGDVVVAEAEVCHEEALDISFALYGVAHRRLLLVAVAHVLDGIVPVAV